MSYLRFPEGFLWGATTSAHQIEGAAAADGKGPSIWDIYERRPGNIRTGETAAVACDHYRRFREDVGLMADLGLKAYQFSIAWPRVMPDGRGRLNPKGMDFYDRLVDALLEAGIRPFAMLYHWDLPQALQEKLGGWANRQVAVLFAEYAAAMAHRLGDRVVDWVTHDEPGVTMEAYVEGGFAPGIVNKRHGYQVAHNVLLSHGLAVEALRANCPAKPSVGIIQDIWPVHPASDSRQDREAAEWRWELRWDWLLSPIAFGRYPERAMDMLGDDKPVVEPGDMSIIAAPMDFMGVNYYSRIVAGSRGEVARVAGSQYTDMGWEIYPEGMYEVLKLVRDLYKLGPIFIAESGAAFADEVTHDGMVHDPRRMEYHATHLAQVHRAIADGMDVRGYFAWSLMDNFEWSHGFSKRFGLTYVDYPTQRRIIKDSGRWYAKVIEENGFVG